MQARVGDELRDLFYQRTEKLLTFGANGQDL